MGAVSSAPSLLGEGSGMPCRDPQRVVEGPSTGAGSAQQLLQDCAEGLTPQTSQKLSLSKLTLLPRAPRQGAGSWLPPPSLGSLLHCSWLAARSGGEKRREENPTKVPLKLIVFIAGLTMSCKSFYDPAQEHQ